MNRVAVVVGALVIACVYRGGWAQDYSAEVRADGLLSQLTLDEKISLLGGDVDQFSTHAVTRLGIPKLMMSDGPQGVRNYGPACSFPCGAALASTWDVDLAGAYGKAIALESRARNVNFILGPGMNICRVPVNGRNFEYFGEDPFLAGKIAAHWVRAARDQGVIATIKHFAANNQEWHRDDIDVQVDERTLQEIYLSAFRRAVQEGGALAVMAAYNRINGDYCSANDRLLNQYLKRDWGFTGIVMSDWGACHNTDALANGLDLEMGTAVYFKPDKIKQALADGRITEAQIDAAVHRFLVTTISMGFFDRLQKRSDVPLDSPESSQTALDIARSAIVLLKNDGNALPLDRSAIHRVAVYGPNAENTPVDGGGSGTVTPFHSVSFLEGIRAAAGANVQVDYVPMGTVNDNVFESFPCVQTAVNGQPGLILSVEYQNPQVDLPPTVVPNINLAWEAGHPPFGAPAGRGASFTWSGVLVAPADGDYELVSQGRVTITVGGKDILWPAGTVLHLVHDKPVAIQIKGGVWWRATRPGTAKVTLVPVQLPDLTAAKNDDAVIACVGLNGNAEHEGADRDFDLSGMQLQLISALAAANPKTIVVINGGAAVGMQSFIDQVPSIVEAWYLGQEGGTALGDVLFGNVNPSGRLCSTFDKDFEDNPAAANYPGLLGGDRNPPYEVYAEGIFMGYRGYDKAGKDPLFPFGYGLSYTTFDFKNMAVAPASDGVKVSLDVTNTGSRAGAAVVEIYVGEPTCSVPRPLRELKGFAKVTLDAGQTKSVEISLPRDSFAYWSTENHQWTVDPGKFTIEAGASERDIKCKDIIDIN